MTKQRGFTLIELIIVIIILGILAVTAAPRFFNFADDARAATVEGVYSSMLSASELVRAKALIQGVSDGQVTDQAGPIAVVGGFAAGTEEGIVEALNLDLADWTIDTSTAGTVIVSPVGISEANINTCNATYVNNEGAVTITRDVSVCQ